MIVNIPTPNDFYESGRSLINLSWDTVINLALELDDSEQYGWVDDEMKTPYWSSAKQHLMSSMSIVQQGVEFVLKGRIAEISPFLLISNSPREYPAGSSSSDISFSEFKTIDAQDLIKVLNTMSSVKLSTEFIVKFEELRKKRNTLMHTIDISLQMEATEVLTNILEVFLHLFPQENFVRARRAYLESSPLSALHSGDFVEMALIREFGLITQILTPSSLKKFFGFDKKQRKYICPKCEHEARDADVLPRTALLKPNTAISTNVFCFVCNEHQNISRSHCLEDECKGNVLSEEYEICLTCGAGIK